MKLRTIFVGIVTLLLLTSVSAGDRWPQFRGPQSMGVADDPKFPTRGVKPRM
jgi:hypothetical protein